MKVELTAKSITLQKNDFNSEGFVDITVANPAGAVITDVKVHGAADSALYNVRKVQPGAYAIGFVTQTTVGETKIGKVGKGKTITLDIYLAGSTTPIAVKLKVVVT